MVRSRTHYSRAVKRNLLRQAQKSGKTLNAFAKEIGINPSLLYGWSKHPELTPTNPVVNQTKPKTIHKIPIGSSKPTKFELTLANGHRLSFDATVDPSALSRVVNSLSLSV